MMYVSANEKAVSLNLHRYTVVGLGTVRPGQLALITGRGAYTNPLYKPQLSCFISCYH
jgi:hypothetical protein